MQNRPKLVIPLWMKIIKIIGNNQERVNMMLISRDVGPYSSVIRVLDVLESNKLVIRERCGRCILVGLSCAGRGVWEALVKMEACSHIKIVKEDIC